MLIPNVISRNGNTERVADIYSTMLEKRIIFVQSQVGDEMANTIVAQMLFLEMDDPTKPIMLYINSPGGSITAGMAIYDTMQYIQCPVYTIGMGSCASMGAFLLSAGEPGHRYVLPNTEVMIHQPLGGYQGQATDIEIHANRIIEMKRKLTQALADSTQGRVDYDTMAAMCERDNFLTAEEAVYYGIVDEVITKNPVQTEEGDK